MRGIAASWVITGDAAQPPVAAGAVVLDGAERVVAVGAAAELRARYGAARWEERHAVLLPGLVNAHCHLELSALRGRVPGGSGFGPWVTELQRVRDEIDAVEHEQAIERGVQELVDAGTAAVGDVANSLQAVPALAAAPLLGRVFHEIFGLRREQGAARLQRAVEERALHANWPDNLGYALAPHTPFTLHPETLREIVRRVRAQNELTSIHLCEHSAERAFLQHGGGPFAEFLASRGADAIDWDPPGMDPVRYASSLGVLGKDALCVHLADAREDEIAIVAQAGAAVVLCPRSNLHIELRLPPLQALLEAGIEPALGTDSLASCASLDVLEDARTLAERFPSVPARTLLAMATSFGAKLLRLDAELGTLAPGKRPGLLAFEHQGEAPRDPERFVLSRRARARSVLARPARSLPGVPIARASADTIASSMEDAR